MISMVLSPACRATSAHWYWRAARSRPRREAGLSEGFSHFVTSMTAPVASGWSEFAGWGLHTLKSAAFSRRTP